MSARFFGCSIGFRRVIRYGYGKLGVGDQFGDFPPADARIECFCAGGGDGAEPCLTHAQLPKVDGGC